MKRKSELYRQFQTEIGRSLNTITGKYLKKGLNPVQISKGTSTMSSLVLSISKPPRTWTRRIAKRKYTRKTQAKA